MFYIIVNMAQPPTWNLDNYKAYAERRDRLKDNYTNNLNIVKQRSVPAALDYPGAVKEVETAKAQIQSAIHDVSAEAETLSAFLKQLQQGMGPEMVQKINEDEKKLQKLIEENNAMERIANLRKEQAIDQNTKYDSNFHSSLFSYMPWEVESSKWYSFSPINPYIDLNHGSRSTLLFIACIFGISSLIIVGTYVLEFVRTNKKDVFGGLPGIQVLGRAVPMLQKPVPLPILKSVPIKAPALPMPVTRRVA
jgi:hypothetical protein